MPGLWVHDQKEMCPILFGLCAVSDLFILNLDTEFFQLLGTFLKSYIWRSMMIFLKKCLEGFPTQMSSWRHHEGISYTDDIKKCQVGGCDCAMHMKTSGALTASSQQPLWWHTSFALYFVQVAQLLPLHVVKVVQRSWFISTLKYLQLYLRT